MGYVKVKNIKRVLSREEQRPDRIDAAFLANVARSSRTDAAHK